MKKEKKVKPSASAAKERSQNVAGNAMEKDSTETQLHEALNDGEDLGNDGKDVVPFN